MKLFATLFFLLVLPGLHSQTVTIKDRETLKPLYLVSLSSEYPPASITTNKNGFANLADFTGAELIEVRLLGYQPLYLSYDAIVESGLTIRLTSIQMPLSEIVISATRWQQSRRDIPNKITSITPQEVQLQNPQTAADMLGASGEVFVQKSQQGGGSPMIRGFAANRLLYTVDGVRMNTAIFRTGNLQNVISLDPFTIEQTEVFFGPGAVIYGSDAIGGVMSFRTITPEFSVDGKTQLSGNAVVRYSSVNSEKTGHLDLSAGWNRWALATSFTKYDYGDLRMGRHGPDEYLKPFFVKRVNDSDSVFVNDDPIVQRPSGYTQTNLMQKIRFRPNDAWDVQYGFHYSETSSYGRYDRLIETNNQGVPLSAVWDYGPQKWMMNLLAFTHSGQNPVYDRMNLRLAYQSFEESRIDRRLNNARLRTQQENVDAISVNADFLKFTGQNRLIYGLEFVHNNVDSKASAFNIITQEDISVPDRYPASTWASYAGYINYQHRFNPIWLVQAGVRMSHFSIDADFTRLLDFYPFDYSSVDINNQSLTGSIGAVFTPTEFWKLSADLSTGFRAPNVDDIGKMFDFQIGDVIVPNPALKAEYAYNGEVTIARRFGKVLDVDFTGFYTMLDHAMARRAFQVDGQDSIIYNGIMSRVFALQNAAQATVYGFNAGFDLKLPAGFSVSSRFNYQKGEEEMEDGSTSPSRHAAPWFGVARLAYATEKLSLQLYSTFSGEVSYENLNAEERQKPTIYATDENGNPYSPAWHTLNLKTMYQISSGLTITAGIENITDHRYRPYSSGLVAPGRNFVFSLVAGF